MPSKLEWIRKNYGDPMKVFSSLTRGMLTPSPGYELFCADFAAIEARVAFWVAEHEEGVKAFRENRKLYEEMAAHTFGMNAEDVKKDSLERFVGKSATLGCQYGVGPAKFLKMCHLQGMKQVTDDIAKKAVYTYRKVHHPIPTFWKEIEGAVVSAILNPGSRYNVTKVQVYMHENFLNIRLPSGRRLRYFKPRVSQKQLAGGRMVPQIHHWAVELHQWQEVVSWGGVFTNHCFSADTLILTERGAVAIKDIKIQDRIFDGFEFVPHSGIICQGKQKTGNWLNIRVTQDHLIHDGNSWHHVKYLDERTTQKCLDYGHALVNSQLSNPALASMLNPSVFASAENKFGYLIDPFLGEILAHAGVVVSKQVGYRAQKLKAITKLFLTKALGRCGYSDTPEWWSAVTIPNIRRSTTMEQEAYGFFLLGEKIKNYFLNTQKLLKDGKIQLSTWIEKIIQGDMSPAILDVSLENKMHAIDETLGGLPIAQKKSLLVNFGKRIALAGKAKMLSFGIFKKEKQLSKLWHSTGKEELVYDILNCGPRRQFIVITPHGPVVAHNCVQGISRDLMANAMMSIENAGYRFLLSVHDEGLSEHVKGRGSVEEYVGLMTQLPAWAEGCPVVAEGWKDERYRKG